MLKKILPVTFAAIILSFGAFAQALLASQPVQMKLKPNHIAIGATFTGNNITVTGTIPADSEVLIRLVGHYGDVKLKKKGRALGFLWMNMGAVEFQNVPSVFLIVPSPNLEKFSKEDNTGWRKIGLGIDAVEENATIIPSSEDKKKLFKDFEKLKESAELYGTQGNRISYGETAGTLKSFTAKVFIPSDIPQGSYTVELFAIKDGGIVATAEEKITAEEVGFPATLSFLAFHHATLYGILAVIVAIIAGLVTGLLFKGAKGGH